MTVAIIMIILTTVVLKVFNNMNEIRTTFYRMINGYFEMYYWASCIHRVPEKCDRFIDLTGFAFRYRVGETDRARDRQGARDNPGYRRRHYASLEQQRQTLLQREDVSRRRRRKSDANKDVVDRHAFLDDVHEEGILIVQHDLYLIAIRIRAR